jgi:ribonuclease P protein component
VSDAHLIIYIARNELAHARVGLRVGRRLGRAPTRNRIKRLLREAFRLRGLANQHPGFDLVCIPRPGPERTSTIYEASLEILIPKAIHRLERRP